MIRSTDEIRFEFKLWPETLPQIFQGRVERFKTRKMSTRHGLWITNERKLERIIQYFYLYTKTGMQKNIYKRLIQAEKNFSSLPIFAFLCWHGDYDFNLVGTQCPLSTSIVWTYPLGEPIWFNDVSWNTPRKLLLLMRAPVSLKSTRN